MGDDAHGGNERKKVAVACQGGGIHAAFEVGVLTEILTDIQRRNRFDLVGLSGSSAGALCALMVWYGLASKNGHAGSVSEAIERLNRFWDGFAADGLAENLINLLAKAALKARELETPVLGLNAPVFSLNPRGAISKAMTGALPLLGIRRQYYDLEALLDDACPQFAGIDWPNLQTRLLVGATDVTNGIETVFDSARNNTPGEVTKFWRERFPLSLKGVAASGTLPEFRQAERIAGRCYWDGLYSLNPPVREFWMGTLKQDIPEEIWVVRINPQQCAQEPETNEEIQDRQNELMGNLSLNKELDFIVHVNDWINANESRNNKPFDDNLKQVTVRTIKMPEHTAAELRSSSKFDRSRGFIDRLRREGHEVTQEWLNGWPENVGCYPDDAGYRTLRRFF